MGFGPSLASSSRPDSRTSAWKNQAVGTVTALGSRIRSRHEHARDLARRSACRDRRYRPLEDLPGVLLTVVAWVDALSTRSARCRSVTKFQVLLIDTDHLDHPATIATFPSIDRLEYQSVVGKLLVISQGQLTRFDLDLEHLTAKALPVLQTPSSLQRVATLDPARAGGLIPRSPPTSRRMANFISSAIATTIPASRSRPRPTHRSRALLAVDATGTTYVDNDGVLVGHREGRADVEVPVGVAIEYDRQPTRERRAHPGLADHARRRSRRDAVAATDVGSDRPDVLTTTVD